MSKNQLELQAYSFWNAQRAARRFARLGDKHRAGTALEHIGNMGNTVTHPTLKKVVKSTYRSVDKEISETKGVFLFSSFLPGGPDAA